MKILYINPKGTVDENEVKILWANSMRVEMNGGMSYIPRLAPMVLAALTPSEHEFNYIDEDLEKIDFDQVSCDLIAIGGMTVQAERGYYLADQFRSRGFTVVMGGIHASSCPEETALHADAVCTGEADNYWVQLLEDFVRGELKKFYHAKDYPPVTNLTSPKVDIVNHDLYSVFPIQSTKGCPYSCVFCCIKISSGHKHRKKPVEQVVAEIKELEQYNSGPYKKRYHFMDDNLYVDRNYTMDLFKALIPLNIQWTGMGSLNMVQDEETLKLIAASGCRSFYIGFESISEKSLEEAKANKKNSSVTRYREATARLIKYGIIPAGYIIFGFDSDDESIFERTVKFAKENRIINPLFHILTPYPSTPLGERMKERITDKSWRHYGSFKCVFEPAQLTPNQVEAGACAASYELAKLDVIKDHMKHFWSHGPWEKNPRLNLRERIILLVVAHRLRKTKESRDFLIWAAFRHNATDVFQIISSAVFFIEAQGFRKIRDNIIDKEKDSQENR